MDEHAGADVAAPLSGAGFEEMIAALTARFGGFDASADGRLADFRWHADFRAGGALTLTTGRYSGAWDLRSSQDTPQCLAIVIPRKGALNARIGGRTVDGHPGSLVIASNFDAEHFLVRGDEHVSDVLFIDWSVIEQTVSAMLERPFSGSLGFQPLLDLSGSGGRTLALMAETIVEGMREGALLASPAALSHMTQGFADLLVRGLPHRLSGQLGASSAMIAPRHVHRAMDYMRENIAKPMTMPMIAAAAGVSVRALENGFRAFRDTTPALYLRTIRLRAVREDLLDPFNDMPVRDICLKWGFFHVGRFSALYRATYGENPSDAKKRRDGLRAREHV